MRLRIFLLFILGILVVVLIFDRVARVQATAAFKALDAKLPSDESNLPTVFAGLPTPEEVHALLGREPSAREVTPSEVRETYVWPGSVRSYNLHVAYARGPRPGLSRISFIDPFPPEAPATVPVDSTATSAPGGGPPIGAPNLDQMSKMGPPMRPEMLEGLAPQERENALKKFGKQRAKTVKADGPV